ncbi:unnamed protein product [Heligmosomoides polygyrus]|uniref:Phlebovirus_G2 domain-containing protein n=1 Tax=Heligmosomoides polygyrus TaxID=6339 RepID=A0A183G1F2_HELPZ|nr:unnamed protein product [Heligmosomoides polygyrus]
MEENPENQRNEQPYNLRKKPRVDYDRLHHGVSSSIIALALMSLISPALSVTVKPPVKMAIGSLLDLSISYELCAEGYCIHRNNPPHEETIPLPPEITLHQHSIHWKISNGDKMKTLEAQCPAPQFCSKIDCWFCTANVFNPHCQPRTALITIAVTIYGLIALLVLLRLGNLALHNAWRIVIRLYQRLRHPRPRQRHPPSSNLGFIPLVLIILTTGGVLSCQDVDMFEHKTTVCSLSKSRHQICHVDITKVIKLNTFSKEACLRLHY